MFHDYLILGGAGLVGLQVCRQLTEKLAPRRIVVASLVQHEAEQACRTLEAEFGDAIAFVPAWGNLFVPSDLANLSRRRILEDGKLREELLQILYGPFEAGYQTNHLVNLIRFHRPEVIVDCVNTATGLSYQNVFDGAAKILDTLKNEDDVAGLRADVERFLLSQSVPQLIRHVRFVHRATCEYGTRVYVKCGTTGTGGMGLNIPYTHSEDKPSKQLLAKTEAAFGHTGLLFLLARTPDAPIVKEVKPAAMIGYRAVRTVHASDKHGNDQLFVPKQAPLGDALDLAEDPDGYQPDGKLMLPVVDTGENGLFARGEFTAITAMGQMEYVTPEEIAAVVVREIQGASTGQDIVSALDSSVMNPSYKAGLVRAVAVSDLEHAETESELPSVAVGRLGPPELSKLLFEAQLLKECFGSLQAVVEVDGQPRAPREISAALTDCLDKSPIRRMAPSIGIPILLADGTTLMRGPRINVPEIAGHRTAVASKDRSMVDRWARKGWIDLRPANMQRWSQRISKMIAARIKLRAAGSAVASRKSYLPTTFDIGEVVAWIFNNELDGYRVK